jgi:hypothetical protein
MLLLPSVALGDATQRVLNGDFEVGDGLEAPPWTFADSAHACNVSLCGQPAASGARYAALPLTPQVVPPNSVDNLTGQVSQPVQVPEAPATLTFMVRRIDVEDTPVYQDLVVSLGGTQLTRMMEIPATFQAASIPIPPGSISAGLKTLQFEGRCGNPSPSSTNCDVLVIDQISLVTGTPPQAPAITGTDPPSPGATTTVRVRGTVTGGADQVHIYANGVCSGAPAATGTAADFTGAGIQITVPADQATQLTAKAVNLAGESGCSAPFAYVERDTDPPQTSFAQRPPNRTRDRTPTFRFRSDEPPGSHFECKLDNGAFKPCRARHTTKRLKFGKHVLRVRAVDAAGNRDPTPAVDRFRVIRGRRT